MFPPKKTAAPKLDLKAIRRWMEQHVDEHIDDVNEVNATGLGEAAAEQFDAYEDRRDYKIPEEVFDMAAEVAIKEDATAAKRSRNEFILAPLGVVPRGRGSSVQSLFPRQAAGDDLRTLAVGLYKGILGKAGHEVAKAIQEALKQAFELGQQGRTAKTASYTPDQVRDWMQKHAPAIGGERGGFDPQELAKQAAEYFGINGDIPEWVYDAAMNVSASTKHATAARLVRLARKLLAAEDPAVRWRFDQDPWETAKLSDILADNEWTTATPEIQKLLADGKVSFGGGAQPSVEIELV